MLWKMYLFLIALSIPGGIWLSLWLQKPEQGGVLVDRMGTLLTACSSVDKPSHIGFGTINRNGEVIIPNILRI